MQGSSAFQFARAVRRAGLMSRRQLIADGLANLRFRLLGATDAESEALRARIASSLAGIRVRDLQRLGAPVLAGILPRLYPRMLEIAYEHQDAGREIYIVTAAAQSLADALAQVIAFDGAIGSELSEVDGQGVFTGRATGPFVYREQKAEAVRRLAAERGLRLADCWAYSDSASDLPMLEAVGHAVVVNPDGELTRLARERGWETVRLDRLGARLRAASAVLAITLASAAAARLLGRRRPAGGFGAPAPEGPQLASSRHGRVADRRIPLPAGRWPFACRGAGSA
jgi:HAD superfamily hydrolase (TIGR01490 family)